MYCPNCGDKVTEGEKFCSNCGKKLPGKSEDNKKPEVKEMKAEHPKIKGKDSEEAKQLLKRYKDTGNTSIALSILGFIVSIFISMDEYTFSESLLGAIIMLPFIAPYFYFGKKLKNKGIDDLNYGLKVSKGMLIYTAVFIVINLLMGGIGWLWFFVLYYYYKSYKETKIFLKK